MYKKLNKSLKLLLVIFVIVLMVSPNMVSHAASVTMTFSTKEETVVVGKEVLVTLKLKSDDSMGDFEGFISYNPEVLEFISDADFIAGGDGLLKITNINVSSGDSSRKYVIKFKAKKIGKSDIAIKDKADLYDFETGLAMSVSSNQIELLVVAADTASDNADLKSLKISPSSLSPDFNKNTTQYSTSVSALTEQLIISTVTEDEKATVSIKGNEKLLEGSNNIVITVKAESGKTKEYIIETVREQKEVGEGEEIIDSEGSDTNNEANPLEYNDIDNTTTNIGILQIIRDGEDIYIQNGFRYQIKEVGEDVIIPEGYQQTSLIINGITIQVYTLKKDLESDFLLLYASNDKGETGFYQYDRVENTIQRYVNKNSNSSNQIAMTEIGMLTEEYKSKLIVMGIITAVIGALCIILSVALIRKYMHKNEE